MKNIILTVLFLLSGLVMAQEVRKEVDLPNAVFDCLVKIRDSRGANRAGLNLSGMPLKVTEISDGKLFLRYEFKMGKYDVQVFKEPPFDYQFNFIENSDSYSFYEVYLYNNTLKGVHKFFYNSKLSFNVFSEKREEIFLQF